MKYTDEQRLKALESCKEIGVAKTAELMKISAQTLYKWVNVEKKGKPSRSKAASVKKNVTPVETKKPNQEHKALMHVFMEDDKALLEKVSSLEEELSELRQRYEQLKHALLAFLD